MLRKTILLLLATISLSSLCGIDRRIPTALTWAATQAIRQQLTSRFIFCSKFTNPCQDSSGMCACVNLRKWLNPDSVQKAITDVNREIVKIPGGHKVIE